MIVGVVPLRQTLVLCIHHTRNYQVKLSKINLLGVLCTITFLSGRLEKIFRKFSWMGLQIIRRNVAKVSSASPFRVFSFSSFFSPVLPWIKCLNCWERVLWLFCWITAAFRLYLWVHFPRPSNLLLFFLLLHDSIPSHSPTSPLRKREREYKERPSEAFHCHNIAVVLLACPLIRLTLENVDRNLAAYRCTYFL